MSNYTELTQDEVWEVTRGKISVPDGLYHYPDREEEEEGWNKMNHFIYRKYDDWIWTIDYAGKTVYFGMRDRHLPETITVSKETFINFVKEKSPEAMTWILFHLAGAGFTLDTE